MIVKHHSKNKRIWLMVGVLFMSLTMGLTVSWSKAMVHNFPTLSTVVHADKKADSSSDKKDSGDKDKDKDSSDSDSDSDSDSSGSSGSSSASASAWNSALSTLSDAQSGSSGSSTSSDSSSTSSDSKDAGSQQATLDDVVKNGHQLNAWGFMGNGNSHLWEKQNNSSWTVSYNSLYAASGSTGSSKAAIQDKTESNSYKQAARFAYAMQAGGLDQPVKAGFSNTGLISQIAGWIMQLSYFILNAARSLFLIILSILQSINPINWALYGAGSSNQIFAGLAKTVHHLYQVMQNLGWAICGLILAGSLALAGMGISVGAGDAHVGAGQALTNVLVNLLKRFFVWIMLPIFGLAFFSATVDNVGNAFQTEKNSVPNYAVYGSLIDYNDWVMNSRLALPSDVKIRTSFDIKKLPTLTHNQILAINYKGAGVQGLNSLMNINSSQKALEQSTSKKNTKLNQQAQSLLKSWNSGATITAADYASVADASIRGALLNQSSGGSDSKSDKKDGASDSSIDASAISNALVQTKYNNNGSNYADGTGAGSYFHGTANAGTGAKTSSGIASPLDAQAKGGLSTLGTYAYMLTTAGNNQMSIADTENLANDVAQPEHRSAILVGTGMESTGNLVWAFGMMVGLALLVVGYLLEVLKTIIQSLPGITMATLQTALMSLRGGVQFISVLAGLCIGVFGSAIMYLFAQMAYISLAEVSDQLMSSHLAASFISNVSLAGHTQVGQLSAMAAISASQSALNIAYGVFLLWIAFMLLRYRGAVVASIGSLVQDTTDRIMNTFGSLSKQGSSGTKGAIMNSSNASNSWSNGVSNIAKQAGGAALLAGGAGAAKSALTGGGGGKGGGLFGGGGPGSHTNKAGKDTDKTSDKTKNNEQNQRQNQNTSSSQDRLGNASERQKSLMPQANDMNDQQADKDAAHQDSGQNQNGDNRTSELDHTLDSKDNQNNTDSAQDQLQNLSSDSQNAQPDSIGLSNATQDQPANAAMGNAAASDSNALDSQNGQSDLANAAQDQSGQSQLGDGLSSGLDSQSQSLQDDQSANSTQGQGLQNALSSDSNSLGNSQDDLSKVASPNEAQEAAAQQQQELGQSLGLGKASLGQQLGDGAASAGNALGSAKSANSIGLGQAGTPVDSKMSASKVQSQMGGIQSALSKAQSAQGLAESAPENQTLSANAQAAGSQLSGLQNQAVSDYNQQAVGDNSLRSGWLGDQTKPDSLSVGSADSAMNSVYEAQNKVSDAVNKYGSGSDFAKGAQQNLDSARKAAVEQGLSSSFVGDTHAVSSAHDQVAKDVSSVMNGSWRGLNASASQIGNDVHDSIGI